MTAIFYCLLACLAHAVKTAPPASERYAYTLLSDGGGDAFANGTHPLAPLHAHNTAADTAARCLASVVSRRNETIYGRAAVDVWHRWAARAVGAGDTVPPGVRGYSCFPGLPTGMSASSVDELHPHDVDIYVAFGARSVLDGTHARCGSVDCMFTGSSAADGTVAFASGSKGQLADFVTVPNIFRRYNRHVGVVNEYWQLHDVAASSSAASPSASSTFFADSCANLPLEADMVVRMVEHWHPEHDIKWKLVTLLVGCGEMQCVCHNDDDGAASDTAERMLKQVNETLHVLKRLTRTIVSIVPLTDMAQWRAVWKNEPFCSQWVSQCYDTEEWKDTNRQFKAALDALVSDDSLHSDSFTVVVQPIFMDDGQEPAVAHGWLSLDCEHLSAQGHAMAARALWNAMLTPVGKKAQWDASALAQPLQCPDARCPFIATRRNSIDCQFMMQSRFGRSSLVGMQQQQQAGVGAPAQMRSGTDAARAHLAVVAIALAQLAYTVINC